MRPAAHRRWPTLFDLMVLTAATGAAVSWFRPYLAALRPDRVGPSSRFYAVQEGAYGAWSLVAAGWMLALLLILRRRPRIARSRLARRPGQVACVATLVALLVGALQTGLFQLLGDSPRVRGPSDAYLLWIWLSNQAAPTILGAWLVVAVSGHWRADPGWVDRLGRLLALPWVAWRLHFVIPYQVRSRWSSIYEWFVP